MNGIRPSLGIEFDDKYIDAKNKLYSCYMALCKLPQAQTQQIVREFIADYGMTASFKQIIEYIKNGGRF